VIDRIHRLLKRCPRLDLDDENDIAASGDKIDFSRFGAIAAANNAIALQNQRKGGKALGGVTRGGRPWCVCPLRSFHRQ